MVINISNFFNSSNKSSIIGDFQDLDHIDGVSVSSICANLYNTKRDDLVLFYFRDGANYASVYTQLRFNILYTKSCTNSRPFICLVISTRGLDGVAEDHAVFWFGEGGKGVRPAVPSPFSRRHQVFPASSFTLEGCVK